MKKLLFFVAEDSYFCSHRINLGKTAHNTGFEVALVTKCTHHFHQIQAAGIKVFPLKNFTRNSLNPFRQLYLFWELHKIYKSYRPDVVHQVAMQPVILGSLIALWNRVPRIINALGGLGYLFTEGAEKIPSNPPLQKRERTFKKQVLRYFTSWIFRFIFSRPNSTLILQNQDDLQTLVKLNVVNPHQVSIIQGAGIDTNAFPVTPPPFEPPVIIACISRMLWDKGIGELIQAAVILKEKKISAKIMLFGMPDPQNPTSISEEQLQKWHDNEIIVWKGHCNQVAKAYADCHIAVLPSYREGLPKSLLEAASCGRPIVTTDVPGCREVVRNEENGFLVPAKDSEALANALTILIQNPSLRRKMGEQGRYRVEKYFSEPLIHQQTLALYVV